MNQREELLKTWSYYLSDAARKKALTRKSIPLSVDGIVGPRAGALEIFAGMEAPALLSSLSRHDKALLRQFIPWQFPGEPSCYMSGRYVRVEAGWPFELAETMIRLSDLGRHPHTGGNWTAGKNERGATVIAGFNDKTPHYLVAGTTGSGKSVVLRSAIMQLSQDRTNQIVLIDGKSGEGLGDLAHLSGVVAPVAMDNITARSALAWACAEMRRRYGVGEHDGRLIVAIDEFQEWSNDNVFVDLMRKIAAQGRAAGVHLLAATQHPTVNSFGDETTRRNLVGKLALRVGDPDASRVAVGGRLPRADFLLGAGDGYAISPSSCHRLQMAYIDNNDILKAGSGEWLFEEWPDSTDAIGQELPRTYTGQELAIALASAVEDEGRVKFQRRLNAVGLPTGGNDRAVALLELARDQRDNLEGMGYECRPSVRDDAHTVVKTATRHRKQVQSVPRVGRTDGK